MPIGAGYLRKRSTRLRLSATLGAGMAVAAMLTTSTVSAAADQDRPTEYVALGDSFAAAPLVLPQVQVDPCLRSALDYAHVLAKTLHATTFRDVTCSGATTANVIDTPQRGLLSGDTVAPQVNALSQKTDLVTVSIGANDLGLAGLAFDCLKVLPVGQTCKSKYTSGGVDRGAAAVDGAAPAIARTVEAIRDRAPHARIVFTSYGLYVQHDGCYPLQPLLPSDANYVQGLVNRLGRVTAKVARAHGAEYVDFIGPGAGHDGCQPLQNWVNIVVPGATLGLAPFHPTALGENNFARILASHLRTNAIVR